MQEEKKVVMDQVVGFPQVERTAINERKCGKEVIIPVQNERRVGRVERNRNGIDVSKNLHVDR